MASSDTNPIDYLIIGHLAKDLTPRGPDLGGTVAYAGRTANALGCRVRAVTSVGNDINFDSLIGLQMTTVPTKNSTTFENRYTSDGREQILHARATELKWEAIPPEWRTAHVIHLGPIADEVDPSLIRHFPDSFIGITPQGWLRRWDEDGHIRLMAWEHIKDLLPAADAVVLSIEDLLGDQGAAQEMAKYCDILALTEGARGARVFWRGQECRLPAPTVKEVDPTGSGDIFAAAFFVRLYQTGDAWEAGRFANYLAAKSVTRYGMTGAPTADEIQAAYVEVRQ